MSENHDAGDGLDLFTDDFAEVMKKRAGKPYRPSNGTEGDMFQVLFCGRCTKDSYDPETGGGELCPIIGDTMCCDVDSPEYPKAWVISERGQPVCKEFAPASTQKEDSSHVG